MPAPYCLMPLHGRGSAEACTAHPAACGSRARPGPTGFGLWPLPGPAKSGYLVLAQAWGRRNRSRSARQLPRRRGEPARPRQRGLGGAACPAVRRRGVCARLGPAAGDPAQRHRSSWRALAQAVCQVRCPAPRRRLTGSPQGEQGLVLRRQTARWALRRREEQPRRSMKACRQPRPGPVAGTATARRREWPLGSAGAGRERPEFPG